MKREELRGIVEGITDEQIKAILDINTADIGKAKEGIDTTKAENETLKADKEALEKKITELNDAVKSGADAKKELEDLQKSIKEKEDADKAAKEDAELTAKIEESFGDKKFTSDYVRTGIIADMKAEIAKPENKGKGYTEIFDVLTKDKEGIFANPNPPANMTGMGAGGTTDITKEQFAKMGYKERNELFMSNKDLYDKLKE